MPGRLLLEIVSYSVLIAAVIGAVRFKVILKSYRPFVYVIWAGLFNEIIATIFISMFHDDSISNNIYTLFDFSLIMWLFINWDEMGNKKKFLRGLLIFGVLWWITENLVLHAITKTSTYFRPVYGIIVVYLSVEEVNKILFNEVRRTYKNAKLIISITFLAAYSYVAVLEVFGVIGLPYNTTFLKMLYDILSLVNLLANLSYALAMLWIPTKRQFTLPY